MPEIKTPLIEALNGDYIITEEHTIGDILRFCVDSVGIEDVKYLVDEMIEEENYGN